METTVYLQFVFALLVVLGLIGGTAIILRRFGPMLGSLAPRRGSRRLSIVEILPLDPKHRLLLVRRDGVEHLLLLGNASNRVIETGIAAPMSAVPFAQQLSQADPTAVSDGVS